MTTTTTVWWDEMTEAIWWLEWRWCCCDDDVVVVADREDGTSLESKQLYGFPTSTTIFFFVFIFI